MTKYWIRIYKNMCSNLEKTENIENGYNSLSEVNKLIQKTLNQN